mmetsp:Transcript_50412/g.80042  ORF Transcript_50412/g.80042 Transcript_50412/m.80042 type:complete len:122 (-) Transcript_50412:125-490(-)
MAHRSYLSMFAIALMTCSCLSFSQPTDSSSELSAGVLLRSAPERCNRRCEVESEKERIACEERAMKQLNWLKKEHRESEHAEHIWQQHRHCTKMKGAHAKDCQISCHYEHDDAPHWQSAEL